MFLKQLELSFGHDERGREPVPETLPVFSKLSSLSALRVTFPRINKRHVERNSVYIKANVSFQVQFKSLITDNPVHNDIKYLLEI